MALPLIEIAYEKNYESDDCGPFSQFTIISCMFEQPSQLGSSSFSPNESITAYNSWSGHWGAPRNFHGKET
jgi:hypothetical protein